MWQQSPPATARREVVYAIGDIHGRFDLFRRLMALIEADWNERRRGGLSVRVIVLGDFIDRGPESDRLLDVFRKLCGLDPPLEVLQGNHEAMMIDSLVGDEHALKLWMKSGGIETLESFGITPPAEDEDSFAFAERAVGEIGYDVVDWLRDLPASAVSGDYFFCHAGIRPGVALRKQTREDMLWVRKSFMESDRNHGAVIVHGHNIVDEVEERPNRISLDTGAYRSNKLSAICLDGDDRRILTT